jgi:hypothetical protein
VKRKTLGGRFLIETTCSRTPMTNMPKVHVFLSYTTREEEVAALQPVTDAYCDILLRWASSRGVNIFYDRSSIPQDRCRRPRGSAEN